MIWANNLSLNRMILGWYFYANIAVVGRGFKEIAINSVKRNDYKTMFWNMTKNEVLNLLKYFDLNEKSGYISFLFVFFFYFICLEAEKFLGAASNLSILDYLQPLGKFSAFLKRGLGSICRLKTSHGIPWVTQILYISGRMQKVPSLTVLWERWIKNRKLSRQLERAYGCSESV